MILLLLPFRPAAPLRIRLLPVIAGAALLLPGPGAALDFQPAVPAAGSGMHDGGHHQALDPFLLSGMEHLRAGRLAEAAEAFLEGRRRGGEDPRLWLYRGYALLREGEYVAAEEDLTEAAARTGEAPEALRLLGQLYYDTGRLWEALQVWERALEKRPEDVELTDLVRKTRRELAVEEEMTSEYGANFIVSFDGQALPELGAQVLEVLEEAYNEVGYALDFFPRAQVPVLIYTRKDFASLTNSPDWAGGLYDGKIRLPLGGVSAVDDRIRALLYHEYSHVAVHFLTRGRTPVWLNEGLAEMAGRRHHDPPLTDLDAAVRQGRLLPLTSLEGAWDGLAEAEVRLAYQQSFSFVAYLVQRFGWAEMAALMRELGAGQSLRAGVKEVWGGYGVSLEELDKEWRRRLSERNPPLDADVPK